jgi:hypothetical protein
MQIMGCFFIVGDTKTVIYEGEEKTLTGEGDPSKCLTIINSFLESAADDMCYPKPCAIGQTYQPSLGTDIFFAIAAFTYAPYSLNTVNSSGILNIDLLNTTAFNYCQKVRIFIIYFCNAEWSFSFYLRAVRFNGFSLKRFN